MTLTPEQMAARREVPASFVPALMAGDEKRITEQWLVCVGETVVVDLSDVWDVQRGVALEPAILYWHQRRSGHAITRRGWSVTHPTRPYVSATLDGMQVGLSMVIDAKAPGRWRKVSDVIAYYTPQMVVQKACVGAEAAALLVSSGGDEPELHILEWTPEYEAQVWERIDWFWSCVETFTHPAPPAPIAAPVPQEKWRTVNLNVMQERGNPLPNWAGAMQTHLTEWANTEAAAKANRDAAKNIKDLLPDDVGRLVWSDIVVSRARNNAVHIKTKDAA
jgi:hypothetical protein